MKIIYLFLFYVLLYSCSNNDNYEIIISGKKKNLFDKIEMDSILVSAQNTSLIGTFLFIDSSIVFYDHDYASMNYYGLNGKFKYRKLGLGRGPNELPSAYGLYPMVNSDKYLAFGSSALVLHEVDKTNWSVKKLGSIDYGWKDQILNNPDPTHYSSYGYNDLVPWVFKISQINNDYAIMQYGSTHVNFSGYGKNSNADTFYREARVFGVLDMNNLKIVDVFGKIPKIYQNYNYIPNYLTFSFTNKNDTIYTAFAADSLITAYTFKSEPLYSFGFEGKRIDRDYVETKNRVDADVELMKTLNGPGYMLFLEYIKETGLLFRSYYRGSESSFDGLQIYKGVDLIADVDIPKRFQLLGYIKPYYYGVRCLPNHDSETFTFYKFKLSTLLYIDM